MASAASVQARLALCQHFRHIQRVERSARGATALRLVVTGYYNVGRQSQPRLLGLSCLISFNPLTSPFLASCPVPLCPVRSQPCPPRPSTTRVGIRQARLPWSLSMRSLSQLELEDLFLEQPLCHRLPQRASRIPLLPKTMMFTLRQTLPLQNMSRSYDPNPLPSPSQKEKETNANAQSRPFHPMENL